MKNIFVLFSVLFLVNISAHAQHEHHMMHDTIQPKKQPEQAVSMEHMNMEGMEGHHMNMSHNYSLNLPMSRNGSGTGWLPDVSPMYGYMFHTPKWMYMLHGNVFLRYNNQDFTNKGSRGDEKLDAPNWFMLMGQRQVAKNGLFHFSIMSSLDALTGGNGYPLLFQSGEAYKGHPLVDRQHPHDLFSELSVSYAQALSKKADVFVYLGYPGEPALGPVAFMHRPSALSNPDAPLSHHWQDATHITFGVATIGVRYGNFKLEGSSFTGREPDEHRYGFDQPRFDSWSGRLSYNPSRNWALQVSHGHLKSPEQLHPEENVDRTTASAIFSKPVSMNGTINITGVWGMNKTPFSKAGHSALLEGEWRSKKLALYGRYEWVEKSVGELDLDPYSYVLVTHFDVQAITLGFNYDLFTIGKTKLAGGGQLSLYPTDKLLYGIYGKNPLAAEVYLRIYPSMMKMK